MLGDHIRALKDGRWLHGIDLGDQRVLYLAEAQGLPPGDRLRRVYRPEFTAGARRVEVVVHREPAYPAKAVVARAWSRFMDPSVVAMFKDSEAFAAWCKIGRLPESTAGAQPPAGPAAPARARAPAPRPPRAAAKRAPAPKAKAKAEAPKARPKAAGAKAAGAKAAGAKAAGAKAKPGRKTAPKARPAAKAKPAARKVKPAAARRPARRRPAAKGGRRR